MCKYYKKRKQICMHTIMRKIGFVCIKMQKSVCFVEKIFVLLINFIKFVQNLFCKLNYFQI